MNTKTWENGNKNEQLTSTAKRLGLLLALCGSLAPIGAIAATTPADDSLGTKLVAPADPRDAQALREALDYLSHSAKAREIISSLQNCNNSHKILAEFASTEASAQPGDGYVEKEQTIYWVPTWGFRWNTGLHSHKQTAALALIHEMGHAYHAALDPVRYENDCKPYSDAAQRNRWTSPEEKRTITEIENVVSKELNEPLTDRHNWTGVWAEHYKAVSPRSTVEQKNTRHADDSAFSNLSNLASN